MDTRYVSVQASVFLSDPKHLKSQRHAVKKNPTYEEGHAASFCAHEQDGLRLLTHLPHLVRFHFSHGSFGEV